MKHPLVPHARADRFAWASLAAGAAVVVYLLAEYWGANPGYADRFLILIGAGYAAHLLAPYWNMLTLRPRPVVGIPVMVIGFGAFAIGCFLSMQIGPRPLLLWWLATAIITTAIGFILVRLGVARLRAALFPLLFPLFALPIPLRVLNPLQDHLQEITTSLSFTSFSTLGFTVHREEFVLALPGGKLRVEEACSGVRSVTALTAIAAFVAFWQGFGPVRGGLLFLVSIPVVAAVNVVRVVLSGLIQESIGSEYIRDDWHEGLGFIMIFVGLALILLLAKLLGPRAIPAEVAAPVPSSVPSPILETRSGGWLPAGLLGFGILLTGAGFYLGQTVEEQAAVNAPLDDISRTLPGWTGIPLPIPPVVTELLAPDVAIQRQYTNNVGQDVYVWAFYWGAGSVIKGYHHPDVCWGNKGFQATSQWTEPIAVGSTGAIPVTAREFHQGRERQIVFYWTQEGRRIWTDDDERAAERQMLASSWHGHKWVGDLLGVKTEKVGARLQVVVIIPAVGTTARKDAAAVTRLIAEELYRTCPWATPE